MTHLEYKHKQEFEASVQKFEITIKESDKQRKKEQEIML
jgi:hypothetical protein